ncbi:MAG TPA: nucleotidyltransferase family protein [Candidatus Margulisiibacteriota bacterium]|nr:nucleotidyltransferase family protein [Candidatus Margulisiibacteriota bacterium]
MEPRTLDQIRAVLRDALPALQAKYQVTSLAVFGSYVHHTARESSDIDLLVSFSDPPGLLRFVELENVLSARLGVKVDLVMRDALKPRIGRRVLAEAVPV